MAQRPSTSETVRIAVRVQPRSSRNRVAGMTGDCLKVQVSAPPVDGKANEAVIEVVAKWLGIPKRSVRITVGEGNRNKVLEITGESGDGMVERVRTACAGMVDIEKAGD